MQGPVLADGVLQQQVEQGQVKLEYRVAHGYLESVLKALKVPISSQTLVFSKTSLQRHRITRDIGFDKPKPAQRSQAGEIAFLDLTRVKGIEVVDAGHLRPAGHQCLAEVRPDESSGAGDEIVGGHAFGETSRATTARKYSIVRRRPSSSATCGSHASVLRA